MLFSLEPQLQEDMHRVFQRWDELEISFRHRLTFMQFNDVPDHMKYRVIQVEKLSPFHSNLMRVCDASVESFPCAAAMRRARTPAWCGWRV